MKKVLLFLSLMILNSCAIFGSSRTSCPILSIIPDASFVNKYEEGTNKVFVQGNIENLQGFCQNLDQRNLNIEGTFDLKANLPEVSQVTTYVPFNYFVAILDDKNNIIEKNQYTKVIKFKAHSFTKVESVDVLENIRIKPTSEVRKYHVLISFQLTDLELQKNRNRKNPYK